MTAVPPVVDEAEIAVVGGGPAGAVAAFTLASKGHDVLLIDKQSFPREKACGDGLSSSAVSFLGELGLSDVVDGAYTIERTRVVVDWKRQETKRRSSRAAELRQQACCVRRLALDDALLNRARGAGVRFLQATVTEPVLSAEKVIGVEVVENGERAAILARHLIAADGSTSRLRRQLLGAAGRQAAWAYGVRRYVRTGEPRERIFDIYVPVTSPHAGYGWVFPISEYLANVGIGYVTARGLPRPLSLRGLLDSFIAGLQDHRGSELGSLEVVGPVRGAPLGINFSPNHCQLDGVSFAGDAARTCDPLTGEGIDQAMRSAHVCALSLHRAIGCGRRPIGVGRSIARSNPRLGQDSAMLARLGRELLRRRRPGEPDSMDVLSEPAPFFSAVMAMLAAEVDRPSMAETPCGRIAPWLGFADALLALDERIRDQVSSEFILASELLRREVCAGVGPVGALVLFASGAVCGAEAGDRSMKGALSVELLRVFPMIVSRVVSVEDDQTRANNALAVIIGDYGLSLAVAASAELGSKFGEMFAKALTANSEGIALLAHDQAQVTRSVGRYIERAHLTSATNLSLAASIGARLAGADRATLSALRTVGESLGLAVQICEDILALAGDDPVTGRRPRHILEEGHFSLPILLALTEDPGLTPLLVGEKESAEWDGIVDLIRRGQGLTRAVEICKRYAERAQTAAIEVAGNDSPIVELCKLPERCLTPLTLLPPAEPQVPSTVAIS